MYQGELPDSATGLPPEVLAAAGLDILMVGVVVAAFGLLVLFRLRPSR